MKQRIETIPTDLLQLKGRFEHWRCTRIGSNKTPLEFWAEAVALSYKYGITLTSRQLGLNHATLKVQRQKLKNSSSTKAIKNTTPLASVLKENQDSSELRANFVELTPKHVTEQSQPISDIQVHLERDGSLKILLKSPQASDWSQLFAGFLIARRLIQGAL